MSRTCQTCAHWSVGICCRFPPVLMPRSPESDYEPPRPPAFVFPETKADDHCGEWAPRNAEPLIERRDA